MPFISESRTESLRPRNDYIQQTRNVYRRMRVQPSSMPILATRTSLERWPRFAACHKKLPKTHR